MGEPRIQHYHLEIPFGWISAWTQLTRPVQCSSISAGCPTSLHTSCAAWAVSGVGVDLMISQQFRNTLHLLWKVCLILSQTFLFCEWYNPEMHPTAPRYRYLSSSNPWEHSKLRTNNKPFGTFNGTSQMFVFAAISKIVKRDLNERKGWRKKN